MMSKTDINKKFYDNKNLTLNVEAGIEKFSNYIKNFDKIIECTTSWRPFWAKNFQKDLPGKRVLEIGAGDFLTSLMMAKFGAYVVANELSDSHREYVNKLTKAIGIANIEFRFGDFLRLDFKEDLGSFDFIVGKGVIHHLTHEQEELLYNKCLALLKEDGICRWTESKIEFPVLQFLVPVRGRPSLLNINRFHRWKESDIHPERDNTMRHYKETCSKYFSKVEVLSFGGIDRFERLFSLGNERFRRLSYKIEQFIPRAVIDKIGRNQLVICYK